jgi:acyl dehydratase
VTGLLHYEDFAAGQVYDLGTHTMTQDEIVAFAREFDPQPQHLDPEAAKHSILGGLAASGWHLCALAMRMIVEGLLARAASLGAPGVEEVQWRRPVLACDCLRAELEVLETRGSSRPERGFVRVRLSMHRAAKDAPEERVMMFVSTIMIGRRPSPIPQAN